MKGLIHIRLGHGDVILKPPRYGLIHLMNHPQRRIAVLTMEIYAPIAQRLGISKIKVELDDLSLKYLEPEAYYEGSNAILRRLVHLISTNLNFKGLAVVANQRCVKGLIHIRLGQPAGDSDLPEFQGPQPGLAECGKEHSGQKQN